MVCWAHPGPHAKQHLDQLMVVSHRQMHRPATAAAAGCTSLHSMHAMQPNSSVGLSVGVCVCDSGVSQLPFKGCIKDVQLGTLAKDLSENKEFKDVSPGCTEVSVNNPSAS